MLEHEGSSKIDEQEIISSGIESTSLITQEIVGQINAMQAGRKLENLDVLELEVIRNKYLELKNILALKSEVGSGLILQAKTEKGEAIEFNFEQIKTYWINFYQENNLPEIAEVVEKMKINLTKEQQDRIKELSEKKGFNKMIIFAGNEIMKNNSERIKQQTEKEMEGLTPEQQYQEKDESGKLIGAYLSDSVKSAFPEKIKNNNRPNKPYIFFCKDQSEVDEETRKPLKGLGKEEVKNSPENIREYFKKQGLTGYTLEEYFVFQREHTAKNKEIENPHPDRNNYTWLLDSELAPGSRGLGRVLYASWDSDDQQVRVDSRASDSCSSSIGARSSAIFEIL
jgi:hypothetical protein